MNLVHKLIMKTIFNLEDLIRPNIKALKAYSSARDEFQGVPVDMVFLDANENPFENGVNRYPDPQQNNLKSLLSNIKGVSEKNILLCFFFLRALRAIVFGFDAIKK